MTTVPTCVKCGASTGTEFPLWPKSNHPFGSICAPCDSPTPAPTMDMRDQQVQDLLEQDKQEALARIRAQR